MYAIENARFQVTSGTKDPPAEKPIKLTKIEKTILYSLWPQKKQDKTLELIKHWSADSTPARNEVIIKTTYPVKSIKCDDSKMTIKNEPVGVFSVMGSLEIAL